MLINMFRKGSTSQILMMVTLLLACLFTGGTAQAQGHPPPISQ